MRVCVCVCVFWRGCQEELTHHLLNIFFRSYQLLLFDFTAVTVIKTARAGFRTGRQAAGLITDHFLSQRPYRQ